MISQREQKFELVECHLAAWAARRAFQKLLHKQEYPIS